jgi:RHS repeat-associated protein
MPTTQGYTTVSADISHTDTVQVTGKATWSFTGGSTAISGAAKTATGSFYVAPAPSNTTAPSVSGITNVAQTMGSSDGSWSSLISTTSVTRQWQRCGYRVTVLGDSPFAWWRLGDSSASRQGVRDELLANNGSYSGGGVTYGVVGALGGDSDTADTLDGTSGFVTLSSGPQFDAGNFTVEAWLKTSSAANQQIWSSGSSGGTQHVSLLLTAGKLQFQAKDSAGTTVTVTTTGTYNNGAWHHVAAVRSGNTYLIYVDGSQVASATQSSPALGDVDAAGTQARIGRGSFSPNDTYYFNGSLDEVAVYKTALSASQVSNHHNAGLNPASNCLNISGATNASYTLANSDYGNAVRLAVTECNADGCTSANSALSTAVGAAYLGQRREYTDIQQKLSDQQSLSVNVANGNLTLTADDLHLPGIAGFDLDYPRYYNSLFSASNSAPVDQVAPGWETLPTLNVLPSGNIRYTGQTGYEIVFTKNGGNYTSPPGVDATLTPQGGSYTLSFHQSGSVQDFDSSGILTDYRDKNGNTITFSRVGGQLASITDSYHHTIAFNYSPGQLVITAPGNCTNGTCTYNYGYDANGRLQTYTDPTGKATTYGYNGAGLLNAVTVSTTSGASETTAIGYDANNRVSSIQTGLDPNSNCPAGSKCPLTTFTYDSVKSGDSFCGGGRTTDVLAPEQQPAPQGSGGNPSRYCFDSSLRVTGVEAPDGTTTSTDYKADNGGSGCTDANGNSYDDLPCSSTNAEGNTTTYAYDANNNLLTTTAPDPDGPGGPLTSPVTTYVYSDASHPYYPTQVTDPTGAITTYIYDAAGNTKETDLNGVRQSAFAYSSPGASCAALGYGQECSSEDGDGNWTAFTYDSNGNVASRQTGLESDLNTCPSGDVCPKTTYTSYDAAGRVLKEVAPLGNVTGCGCADQYTTTYSYDNDGRLLSVTDPLGHTTSYSYDGAGNQTSVTDAGGNRTITTYDPNNRVISVQKGLNYDSSTGQFDCLPGNTCPTTSYTYDGNGNKQTETDPSGNRTLYAYYPTNQVESEQTGLSYNSSTGNYDCAPNNTCPITTYTYDANGDRHSVTDASGNSTVYNYDENQRVTSEQTGLTYNSQTQTYDCPPNDTCPTTKYGYDAAGNRTSVIDADGNATVSTYDGNSRVTSVQSGMQYDSSTQTFYCPTNGNCPMTTYKYDHAGNEVGVIDPNLNATHDIPDNNNLVGSTSSGMAYNSSNDSYYCRTGDTCPTTTYHYDANGNKTSMLEPSGDTVSYSYYRDSRLNQTSYSDSTQSVSYTYDAAGNRNSMTDGGGTVTYNYDNNNQLRNYSRASDTFSYSYDPAGNVHIRTYPNGATATYLYNNNEQLSTVTSSANTTSYTYNPAGDLHLTTLPNGYIETRSYDNAGRLIQVDNAKNNTVLSDYAYTLDPVGNPNKVVQTGAVSSTTTYGYDGNNRLIDACYQLTCNENPGSNDPYIHYSYDGAGNRLTEARPSGTTTYNYNNQNELLSAGSTSYSYDANGNEHTAGARSFTFNAANQLVSTTSSGTTTNYTYDGDSNRLSSATSGTTTNYLWDTNNTLPQLALERDGSGNILRSYLYGIRRVSITSGGNPYYYLYDALGSVVNLTSASGAAEWTYSYEPFGAIRVQTQNDPNAPSNPMQFAGELADPSNGLYDLRARQYDTGIGRFLSQDPSGTPGQTADTYAYADDNPSTNIDPSGKDAWKLIDNAPQGCPQAYKKDESGFHDYVRIAFRASDLCRGHHVAIAAVHSYRTAWPPLDEGWKWTAWARSPDDHQWYSVTQTMVNLLPFIGGTRLNVAHAAYQYLYWDGNWAFSWNAPWNFASNTVAMPCYFGSYHWSLFHSKRIPTCM